MATATKPSTRPDGLRLEDVENALAIVATHVLKNQAYMPIFERLEKELAEFETAQPSALDRAKQIVELRKRNT